METIKLKKEILFITSVFLILSLIFFLYIQTQKPVNIQNILEKETLKGITEKVLATELSIDLIEKYNSEHEGQELLIPPTSP